MAKNSTHTSYASFVPHTEKDMRQKTESGSNLSEAVIQNILNFSKALRVKNSREVGIIEFVLN